MFAPTPVRLLYPGDDGRIRPVRRKFALPRAFLQRRLDQLVKHRYHHPLHPYRQRKRWKAVNIPKKTFKSSIMQMAAKDKNFFLRQSPVPLAFFHATVYNLHEKYF